MVMLVKNQSEQVKPILKKTKNGYAGIKNQSEQVKGILKKAKNGCAGIKIRKSKDSTVSVWLKTIPGTGQTNLFIFYFLSIKLLPAQRNISCCAE